MTGDAFMPQGVGVDGEYAYELWLSRDDGLSFDRDHCAVVYNPGRRITGLSLSLSLALCRSVCVCVCVCVCVYVCVCVRARVTVCVVRSRVASNRAAGRRHTRDAVL